MPNVEGPKRTPNHAMAFGSSFTIEIAPLREALDVVLPPGAASSWSNKPMVTVLSAVLHLLSVSPFRFVMFSAPLPPTP